jgi:hypothetical protein
MPTPTKNPIRPRAIAGLVAASLAAVTAACGNEDRRPLPPLDAEIGETSVSGISSGAYMAGQFQLAHSRLVKGAAIIAGGPYGCAESLYADLMPGPGVAFLNLSKAVNGCMLNALALWGVPNPPMLAEKARRLAEDNRIDPITDVLDDRVYLFSGTEDHTVVPAIVDAAAEFYAKLGLPPDSLKEVASLPAGHAFVTDAEGLACSASSRPYVVDCDYDQAGDLLAHIYGPLNPRSDAPSGTFVTFDQRPFTEGLDTHGLADEGTVYIPTACATSDRCRIHIAFHGCAQNKEAAGDAFVRDTGFARWADTNRLIVLFPQAETSAINPQACWDWWGYTGRAYLTREAPQIVAVHRMLERLGSPRLGPS